LDQQRPGPKRVVLLRPIDASCCATKVSPARLPDVGLSAQVFY
jgi:hypothetical protein